MPLAFCVTINPSLANRHKRQKNTCFQSLATKTPNGSKPLTTQTIDITHSPCRPRIATNQSQTILTVDVIRCGKHHVCVAAPFHLPSKEKWWAGGRNHSSRNHSSTPASTASVSIGRGDVVRTARVPLLHPCRYAREMLSVRERDRRCSPLAFCPRRISVGRAHHYRERMYSIRRFRTKLTFRRNILLLGFLILIIVWRPKKRRVRSYRVRLYQPSIIARACHNSSAKYIYIILLRACRIIYHLWCIVHKNKNKMPNLRSNGQLETPLPLNFSCRMFRNSAVTPNFSIDP